jgi:DnaJ-class molecular chaperone
MQRNTKNKGTKNTTTDNNPSDDVQPHMPFGDINQLMKSAQQIAQNMSLGDKDKMDKMDINQMFEHVSSSLFSTMEQGGNKIDPASKEQMKVISRTMLSQVMDNVDDDEVDDKNFESKINISNDVISTEDQHADQHADQHVDKIPTKEMEFEVVDSDEEADELKPIVDDLHYNLSVSLEEVYNGKNKKLAVNRDRINGKSITKEKRKLEVGIIQGMKNGQEIRFNKQGNEKFGFESGDIVVTVSINNDNSYERIGNNLFSVKSISLYESYAAGKGDIRVVVKHINGSFLVLKPDGNPLHSRDGARKIRGYGMPIVDKNNKKLQYGDLYIRFNLILPETFEGIDDLNIIEKLFPILANNKDTTIYNDKSRNRFDPGSSKVSEVLLDEVTPEDMEQLEFDDESSSESDRSGSESGSE